MTIAVMFENPDTGERWDFGADSFWPTLADAKRDIRDSTSSKVTEITDSLWRLSDDDDPEGTLVYFLDQEDAERAFRR